MCQAHGNIERFLFSGIVLAEKPENRKKEVGWPEGCGENSVDMKTTCLEGLYAEEPVRNVRHFCLLEYIKSLAVY